MRHHVLRPKSAGLLVGALLLAGCGSGEQSWEQGPPPVEVVTVGTRSFTPSQELPGRIEPVRVAEVRARVAGIVMSRNFEEGADVRAGDVLFQIDDRPFKAALSSAQGDLARAEAVLADAKAVADRYGPLVEIEAVSRQDFDAAKASLQGAQASRQSAMAAVETARLNLGYATVTAPITGRIGRALVTEGALVGQGEATPLAAIQQLDPVYADFKRPQADAARIRRAQRDSGEATISISVEGEEEKRQGKLLFSDVTVDRGTGQISLRGEFSNSDGMLLPGMYVRVHLEESGSQQAILVPQRAVRPRGEGKGQVILLGAEDVAETRDVTTGEMTGADWHILSGLKAGDRLVVNGNAVPGEKASVVPNADEKPAEAGSAAAAN